MKYILALAAVISILGLVGLFLLPKTDSMEKDTATAQPSKEELASLERQLVTSVSSEKQSSSSMLKVSEQKIVPAPIQTTKNSLDQKEPEISVPVVSEKKVSIPSESTSDKKYIEIVNPSGFVNTNNVPFTIGEYVGKKVILLNVMTYSCGNCQATFPYVNTWYDKYEDDGLIVIGLHTPEFTFEKDKKNVEDAMAKFGITYPVVMDNDYATWTAYGNRFWPRKYLIDIYGNIIYDHIGEGAYEETEAEILKALIERKELLRV